MKIQNTMMLAVVLGLLHPLTSHAREVYQMKWSATVYTTDDTGKITKKKFTEKDIIAQIAEEEGVDPKTLAFAYIADVGDTEVVDAQTGETVHEIYQFENEHTDVVSTDGTQVVRQAFIDAEGPRLGSIFNTEKSRHDSEGNLIGFTLKGTFNYSIDGAVYSGSCSTGKHIASIN